MKTALESGFSGWPAPPRSPAFRIPKPFLIEFITASSEAFAESWRNSQREQVREALSTLPKEQLKTLELAYFSGYTHVEIAKLLDVPLGTVKGRMRLGLKKIRDYFDSQDMVMPR